MKPNQFLNFILLISFSFFSSCIITKQIKTGETLFAEKQYSLAAQLLNSEFNKESDPSVKARKAFLTGECYRLSSETVSAEQWYKTAFELNGDSRSQYLYALMMKSNEKYADASAVLTEYLKESPFDESARSEIEACNLALQWKNSPMNYLINNIGSVNSPAYDYAPVFYTNSGLVFTSDRSSAPEFIGAFKF